MNKLPVFLLFICIALHSCSPGRHYAHGKKIPKQELKEDFTLLRKILEAKHPSLYWYTPKDSMDMYFEKYFSSIRDSMTEQEFTWQVLTPLSNKIRCGHTSIRTSKGYATWSKNRKFRSFPLHLKFWNDTMAVLNNLNRKDSIFKRGTIIRSVNGADAIALKNKIFDHLPVDGYADNFNYIRLSSNFPYYHRNVYGLSEKYKVVYKDNAGIEAEAELSPYPTRDSVPPSDSIRKKVKAEKPPRITKKEKLNRIRSLETDSSGNYAVMTINSFSKGHLIPFFRKSFKSLRKNEVRNLVIDIRINGGGKINASTDLTRYISREKFRIADSISTHARGISPYCRHIKGGWLNNIGMFFLSSRKADGRYHMARYERKYYKPRKKNHFNGDVYILTNGPTFSASTLFCNAVRQQPGIILLGEETGGGWYGNNGILIPDITLPNSKVRVRLPLFRLVQYRHPAEKGGGITPDIFVGPDYKALIKGADGKMEAVKKIISEKTGKTSAAN